MTFPFPFFIPNLSIPATSYANPGGTGNRASLITVSGTLAGGPGTLADVVDGSATDEFLPTAGQTTATIKFDFLTGAQKYIDAVKLFGNATASFGVYTWEGSNDDVSYTPLATGITITATVAGNEMAFVPAVATRFRYFQFRQTSGSTTAGSYWREMDFKINA